MKNVVFASLLLSSSAGYALPGYFDVNPEHGPTAVATLRVAAPGNEKIMKFADHLEGYLASAYRPDPASLQVKPYQYDSMSVRSAMYDAASDCDQEPDAYFNARLRPDDYLPAGPDPEALEGALATYVEEYNKLLTHKISLDDFRDRFNFHYGLTNSRREQAHEIYASFYAKYGPVRKQPMETFLLQALVDRNADVNKPLFNNGYGQTTYKMDGSYSGGGVYCGGEGFLDMQELRARQRRPNCVFSKEERGIIIDSLQQAHFLDFAMNYGKVFDQESRSFTYSLAHQVGAFIDQYGSIDELGLADGSMLSQDTQSQLSLNIDQTDKGCGLRFFGQEDMIDHVMRVDLTGEALPDVVGDVHDESLFLAILEKQGPVARIVDRSAAGVVVSNRETMNLIKQLLGETGVFQVWCEGKYVFHTVTAQLAELGFEQIEVDDEHSVVTFKPILS